jgi:hypothetical protein
MSASDRGPYPLEPRGRRRTADKGDEFAPLHMFLFAAVGQRDLFNYLVGAGEEHRRHLEAEGLRCLQIDDKFELD